VEVIPHPLGIHPNRHPQHARDPREESPDPCSELLPSDSSSPPSPPLPSAITRRIRSQHASVICHTSSTSGTWYPTHSADVISKLSATLSESNGSALNASVIKLQKLVETPCNC
jgi:hypothetical protein